MQTVSVWVTAFLFLGLSTTILNAQTSSAAGSPQLATPANRTAGNEPRPQSSAGTTQKSLPDAPSATSPDSTKVQENGTSNDRLFWTLPNFLTVENAHNIPPLTAGQKFKVVLRTAFDPVEYPYIGFLAGISQATDSEPGFGQGAAGYGKRYAASFADNTIENFMTGAILPSVLRQDPRYYQLGEGTFKHRLGYAISRIFVTRSDSGHNQFNASEVVGSALSAGISTYSYHPSDDRTLANALSVWGTQVGWDTVAIGVKEFWPDIRRKAQKRHQTHEVTGNPQDNSKK